MGAVNMARILAAQYSNDAAKQAVRTHYYFDIWHFLFLLLLLGVGERSELYES